MCFQIFVGRVAKKFGLVIWDLLQGIFNFETEELNLSAHGFCWHKLLKMSLPKKTVLCMCGTEEERLRGRLDDTYACC